MVETWRDSWFEEGTRLIYIVPSRVIHAVLPLQIEPGPSAVARVFVGRIELITPALKRTVTEATAGPVTLSVLQPARTAVAASPSVIIRREIIGISRLFIILRLQERETYSTGVS